MVGGETAEMPGTYEKGKFDIAGFAVGVVDQNKILNKKKIRTPPPIASKVVKNPSENLVNLGGVLITVFFRFQK